MSATENIDETPSGMLLHGIMSSIAEFYSRNLATEVVKGLSQKAAQGGTVSKAPIGYRNIGVRDEFGREVRTVELDEERGTSGAVGLPEVRVRRLDDEPAPPRAGGTRPDDRTFTRAVLLGQSASRRCIGCSRTRTTRAASAAKGVTFAGAHEALVPNEVWDQVQTVLGTHRSAADATQVHEHYLKGTVFCGQCGSRLIVCNAKSSQGTIYPYFVCGSRHGGRGDCTRQAMLIEHVERLVEQFYDHVQISAGPSSRSRRCCTRGSTR